MTLIYLLQEDIDLGARTHSAYTNKEQAEKECDKQNKEYQITWPAQHRAPFWVEEIELFVSD